MSYSTKTFIAIFSIAALMCLIVTLSVYIIFKKIFEHDFKDQYSTYGNVIGNAFNFLEHRTDIVNKNAVLLLSEIVNRKGIPSSQELINFAKEFDINAFYIIDKNGKFIRSSDLPLKYQTNSLFSYSKEYHHLIDGKKSIATTPIIPSYPYDIPAKFTLIPSKNKNYILEAGIHLQYISEMLHYIIGKDKNIISIGIYSPNGYELGSISYNGMFHQGRRNTKFSLSTGSLFTKNQFIITTKINTTSINCPECIQKSVSRDGKYFYLLKMIISLDNLHHKLNLLIIQLSVSLSMLIITSAFAAKILAKKLTRRIDKINAITYQIIKSNDLNLRVEIKGNDEVSKLASSFNQMIFSLKKNQNVLIETERKTALLDLATRVAHDIRSPIAAIEMTLNSIPSSIDSEKSHILHESLRSVQNIANNLLNHFRDPHNAVINDKENLERYVLIYSIIEQIISHKRQEWSKNPCQIDFEYGSEEKLIWIKCIPTGLQCVLSNLLNNAYESLNQKRKISIKLKILPQNLQLHIYDTGIGISGKNLSDILQGLSLKHRGTGLGLSGAKFFMDKIGGSLIINSEETIGTQVILNFPITDKPAWLPPSIKISYQSCIVILDDDPAIHSFWRERLSNNIAKIFHFFNVSQFFDWHKNHPENIDDCIYLVDYALSNDSYNGLDILMRLNIKNNGYLITSHADNPIIQQKVTMSNIWLYPKSVLNEIPILNISCIQQPHLKYDAH